MTGFRIAFLVGFAALLGSGAGCRWFDRMQADQHEKKAEEAAKSFNFGEMIDEGKKADKADKKAKRDPLP